MKTTFFTTLPDFSYMKRADVPTNTMINTNRLARIAGVVVNDERVAWYPVGERDFAALKFTNTSDAEKSVWEFNFAKPDRRERVINDIAQRLNLTV